MESLFNQMLAQDNWCKINGGMYIYFGRGNRTVICDFLRKQYYIVQNDIIPVLTGKGTEENHQATVLEYGSLSWEYKQLESRLLGYDTP